MFVETGADFSSTSISFRPGARNVPATDCPSVVRVVKQIPVARARLRSNRVSSAPVSSATSTRIRAVSELSSNSICPDCSLA